MESQPAKSTQLAEKQRKVFKATGPAAKTLLAEVVEYWLSLYKHRLFSVQTHNTYKCAMKLLFEILPHEVQFVTDLRSAHIENFLDELLRKNYAIPSINHYLKVIKVFCGWVERRYQIPNPAKAITGFKSRADEKKFLSKKQYLKLLAICDKQVASWVKFLAATGIRATVFCNLRWNMYNPENKTIHIPANLTKRKQHRIIGLNKTALSILRDIQTSCLPSSDDLIFTQRNGTPLDRKLLHKKINKHLKQIGLTGGPHALRHYCATQLLKAGVPIIKVSKFLGHADIMTTQKHYEHLVISDFAHVADILDS
jgi:integrase/recombinase XerD